MNCPEKLVNKISSFDAVISCRLHPSIISFSLGVPSVGIIWNSKVKHFYQCCGYADRVFDVSTINSVDIVTKLDAIIEEGVSKNEDYLMSVYNRLFEGIKTAFNLTDNKAHPYDYSALIQHITPYAGTSDDEFENKARRKSRRIYNVLNERFSKINNYSKEIKSLKNDIKSLKTNITDYYEMFYHSGKKGYGIAPIDKWENLIDGKMNILKSKAIECKVQSKIKNDGNEMFSGRLYQCDQKFQGWIMRFRIGQTWFWYLEDGSYCVKNQFIPAFIR